MTDQQLFAVQFSSSSFSFWKNCIFVDDHKFGLNAAGDLISVPMRYSRQRSVLVTGCVSCDYPREIHCVEKTRSVDQYLGVLEKVAAVGRTIVHMRSPIRSSARVKTWIASRDMSSILWPTKSTDIMPMTSIWRSFINEFNMASPGIGNFNELWGEIQSSWLTFVENEYFVLSATVGYLWLDLSDIAEEYNASR
ncbi:hypothetical protein DAPPUDRAFT_107455 [Daphnia pulex]|uniref:Uncharacterized protein n=1 Tax=Daphnia pulex TaxID=6669 RepID=E9GX49_DAPPU|nr:hypothetical protein DAPPUDRAFT_107455 [Daphnia pulex]|eukprot:EFX75925.1 hypothetical protein DAPPUDRAFT_107455 [Daphnia pulex]